MSTTKMKPSRAAEFARNEIAAQEMEARGTVQLEPTIIKVEPQKEHLWLQQLVGEWTFDGETTMQPGQPPERFEGTESVRALGDLWTVAEALTNMPDGSPVTLLTTLGFDPQKKRFVGTFIGSMSNYLWLYDGGLDAAEKVLTLNTEGPDMSGEGKIRKSKDVIEIRTADHRVLTSYMLGDDEKWHEVMKAHYRRSG